MNLIKPKKLQTGDTIAIIAPSGPVEKALILKGKEYLESLGFNVILGKNIFSVKDYLAGCDRERLSDLHSAFCDSSVNAIICARGGYGALRLIDDIDYKLIANNPKIFCGYSDITVLNAMFLKKSNLITFSGPMIQSDFGVVTKNEFTQKEFFNNLCADKVEIIAKTPKYYGINQGSEGIILGGNLSTFVSVCGKDFLPDEKFIFFAEDLNEPSYKIDRYFTQLFNIDKFANNLTAIALGDFLDIDNENSYETLLYEISKKYDISIVSGFPFSHSDKKTTVPYGAYAHISGNTITISDYLS